MGPALLLLALPSVAAGTRSLATPWPAALPCQEFAAVQVRGEGQVSRWGRLTLPAPAAAVLQDRPSALSLSRPLGEGEQVQINLTCRSNPGLGVAWRCTTDGCVPSATYSASEAAERAGPWLSHLDTGWGCVPEDSACEGVEGAEISAFTAAAVRSHEAVMSSFLSDILGEMATTLGACAAVPCAPVLDDVAALVAEQPTGLRLDAARDTTQDPAGAWVATWTRPGGGVAQHLRCRPLGETPRCSVALTDGDEEIATFKVEISPAIHRMVLVPGGQLAVTWVNGASPTVTLGGAALDTRK